MEADFWAASAAEDEAKTAVLVENGMTISGADDTLTAKMAEAGKVMWADFFATVPEAQAVVEAYAETAGK